MNTIDAPRGHVLYELGCAFAACLQLDELVPLVISRCRAVMDAEGASVLLFDAERRELYFPYVADADADVAERLRRLRFPADQGIAGAVLRDGHPLRVEDVQNDARFHEEIDRRSGFLTRNLLCVPLRSPQGIIGVLQVVNRCGTAAFSDEDLTFLAALAGSVAVAIDNARLYAALQQALHEHNQLLALRRELELAAEIQQSILPRLDAPFLAPFGFELHAAMLPARDVAGDFYDFFRIDEARLALVIADVSGKGMPAALFMSISRTLLRATALQGLSPGGCLRQVNRLLCIDNEAQMFVTVFYGILDLRDGRLTFSNGGHNPPLLLGRRGDTEALPATGGTLLGVLEEAEYGERQVVLERGDTLFLYTDGVTEAMTSRDEMFSESRLQAQLRQRTGALPAELIEGVLDAVQRHADGAPPSDDITILCIRRQV